MVHVCNPFRLSLNTSKENSRKNLLRQFLEKLPREAKMGERQSIAQKGVRAIDARNSQL